MLLTAQKSTHGTRNSPHSQHIQENHSSPMTALKKSVPSGVFGRGFGVVGECLTGDSQYLTCLGGVEQALWLSAY